MAYAPWEGALTRTRSVSDPQGSKRQRCQRNPHPPVTRGEGLLWGANSQIENIVVTIKHTERTLSMSFLAGPSAWTTCTNHAPSSNEYHAQHDGLYMELHVEFVQTSIGLRFGPPWALVSHAVTA